MTDRLKGESQAMLEETLGADRDVQDGTVSFAGQKLEELREERRQAAATRRRPKSGKGL